MRTHSTSQCHNKHSTDDQQLEKTQKQEKQAQQIFSKNLLVIPTNDSMYAHIADMPWGHNDMCHLDDTKTKVGVAYYIAKAEVKSG